MSPAPRRPRGAERPAAAVGNAPAGPAPRLALVVLAVAAAVAGCGATAAPAAVPGPGRPAAQAGEAVQAPQAAQAGEAVQAGQAVQPGGARGDDPVVTTYQGRLLSRRTAVAVRAADPADWAPVRDRAHREWSSDLRGPVPTSAAVLGPGATEVEPPSAVGLLPAGAPAGASGAEADRLRRLPGAGEVVVADVVVHDLALVVEPAGTTPQAVLAAVAAEGVLADRLGEHTATTDGTRAVFAYTGPLLADDEVEAVVEAVALHAGATPRLEGRGPDPALRAPATPGLPSSGGAPDAGDHGH